MMKILAANRLLDGEAVWFSAELGWARNIAQADIASDKDAVERLDAAGKLGKQKNEIVDPELIDVEIVDGAVRPLRLRERIRAAGPTVRRDLGKQAKLDVSAAA
jgi:hypothetical protein